MKQSVPPPSLLMRTIEQVFIGGLVLIFGLIVLHAPLSVFFGTHFGHLLLVKSWKELLMGVLLILALIIITKRHAWRQFVRDPLLIASLALALLYVVSLQYGHGARSYGAGLLIDLRYVLYAVLVYVAARLFPEYRSIFLRAGLIGAIVVVGFGLLQFLLPKDFLSILGYSKLTITPYTTIDNYEGLVRLQSTLRGPNPLGAYAAVVVLVASIVAIRAKLSRRIRVWLGVLALGALILVFASYSRSAYAGLLAGAFVAAGILAGRRLVHRNVIIGLAVAIILVVGGIFAIRHTTFYTSVLQHEVQGSGPAINSNQGHTISLSDGLSKDIVHPLGYGTGSTGSASLLSKNGYIVENQYLYVAHEAGWVALALFLFIIGALLRAAYQRREEPLAVGVLASGVALLIIGFVLPVFADDTVSIVWFGLAALVAGTTRRE